MNNYKCFDSGVAMILTLFVELPGDDILSVNQKGQNELVV